MSSDTPAAADTSSTRVRQTLVYIGQRSVNSQSSDPEERAKTFHSYRIVDTSHAADQPRLTDDIVNYTKALGSGAPGTMDSFEFSADGTTVYPGTRNYVGVWHNKMQRIEWQAVHDAMLRVVEVARAEVRDTSERVDLAVLEPFRRAYSSMNGPARVQLIGRVAAYIAGMTESRLRQAQKNIEKSTNTAAQKKAKKRPHSG